MTRTSLFWSGLVWFGLAWPGLFWSGLVWFGLVWSGLAWHWPGLACPGPFWLGLGFKLAIIRSEQIMGQPNNNNNIPILGQSQPSVWFDLAWLGWGWAELSNYYSRGRGVLAKTILFNLSQQYLTHIICYKTSDPMFLLAISSQSIVSCPLLRRTFLLSMT